ncbi:esterase [Pseudoalteromonas sp. SSDWG2]|uniref:alpha-L-rhamnosidase-related protein n=1 Tax=Pseudoalteromonas sp. SSDWG2 TaxID=3139391 RepID=UPI003BA9F622
MKNTVVKKRTTALLVAALFAGAPACTHVEVDTKAHNTSEKQIPPLYLRGSFNGWGTSAAFEKVNDTTYQAKVNLGFGIHSFKIASASWDYQLIAQTDESEVINLSEDLNQAITLTKKQTDKHTSMVAEQPSVYVFTVKQTDNGMQFVVSKDAASHSVAQAPHNANAQQVALSFSTFDGATETARFSVKDEHSDLRTYVHSTSQILRDPVPQYSLYSEDEHFPVLRSGNIAFDALFALAIDEMKLDSVANIKDANYNNGQSIACDCFETGEKWNYVWTRDLAYAAHLSFGLLDPQRVKNSLEFKLSGYRDGVSKPRFAAGTDDGLQIIQDTGSGGSWPISTDRVTWAFGAQAALNSLVGAEREAFAQRTLLAVSNTIENDRLVAFDNASGLYNGEQSFLDWREQTYAKWLPDDLSSMATAKAVSTNAAHYQAIRLAQQLANELGQDDKATRYELWADELKRAINTHLWLEEKGLYSSLTAGHFDNTVMQKYDWLGQSLAIITGIASEQQRTAILANYPHGPMGAPVIFPQQPDIPVYHNRAIWPFVTAYGLKAAKLGNNESVANAAYNTLIRAAALNLSNMENLEWLSAQSIWLEKDKLALSGPVINSKRQLWSVAAYLNMVIDGIFGVETSPVGLTFAPYITAALKQSYFEQSDTIALKNLAYKDKRIDVLVSFSEQGNGSDGVYTLKHIKLNGETLTGNTLDYAQLSANSRIELVMGKLIGAHTDITVIDAKPSGYNEHVFAPAEPRITVKMRDGKAVIDILDEDNKGEVTYQVYRNGVKVADDVAAGQWQDSQDIGRQACYSASAKFKASANMSHNSQVVCAIDGITVDVDASNVDTNGAVQSDEHGSFLANWGGKADTFAVNSLAIQDAGEYAIQLEYKNWQHEINTGITAGVKWLVVANSDGDIVHQGAVQLPHTNKDLGTAYSTPIKVKLAAGEYQMSLYDYYNMSYLDNNKTYASAGGTSGALNQFDLYSVRVMPVGSH